MHNYVLITVTLMYWYKHHVDIRIAFMCTDTYALQHCNWGHFLLYSYVVESAICFWGTLAYVILSTVFNSLLNRVVESTVIVNYQKTFVFIWIQCTIK